jgi:hypothetical protein
MLGSDSIDDLGDKLLGLVRFAYDHPEYGLRDFGTRKGLAALLGGLTKHWVQERVGSKQVRTITIQHQQTLAENFRFDRNWPEWRSGSAHAFLSRLRTEWESVRQAPQTALKPLFGAEVRLDDAGKEVIAWLVGGTWRLLDERRTVDATIGLVRGTFQLAPADFLREPIARDPIEFGQIKVRALPGGEWELGPSTDGSLICGSIPRDGEIWCRLNSGYRHLVATFWVDTRRDIDCQMFSRVNSAIVTAYLRKELIERADSAGLLSEPKALVKEIIPLYRSQHPEPSEP